MNAAIPSWIAEKIAARSKELMDRIGLPSLDKAFSELEDEAAILLRADLQRCPALGSLVPAEFLHLLQQGSFSALSTLERAAMVLIEADAREAIVAINADNLEEFTRLKWESLGSLLKEAAA